jgi:hypothetical protein
LAQHNLIGGLWFQPDLTPLQERLIIDAITSQPRRISGAEYFLHWPGHGFPTLSGDLLTAYNIGFDPEV